MEAQLQLLKKVAYDADHFNYIKSMANTQPVTLPITLLHGVTEEMVPVLEDVFRCNIYLHKHIYACVLSCTILVAIHCSLNNIFLIES